VVFLALFAHLAWQFRQQSQQNQPSDSVLPPGSA
jgi:hypothetical protein